MLTEVIFQEAAPAEAGEQQEAGAGTAGKIDGEEGKDVDREDERDTVPFVHVVGTSEKKLERETSW